MKERMCLLYQKKANCFPFLLSLLFQFLHSLRQRKNLMRVFRQIIWHNHIGEAMCPKLLYIVLQEVPMSHKFAPLIRTT
ncbi:hypothetical protein DW889_16960 [Bacteroides stercoris]|uniref:Uncharacterized protein n=1 Tax=Bacteroides stercoris TaxID=46506 RepID=A0A413UTP3_BACSE|nr:hypothetical protein DW889_16960 [Bacteroides stercoris]